MKNTEIKDVFFHNSNASALYRGTSLIWRKQNVSNTGMITGIYNTNYVGFWGQQSLYNDNTKTNVPFEIDNDGNFAVNFEGDIVSLKNLTKTVKINGSSSTLSYNDAITMIDLSNLDTSNVTDISNIFDSAHKLNEVRGLAKINLNNILYCQGMFDECKNIESVDFGTNKISDKTNGGGGSGIFYECNNLKNIHINFEQLGTSNYCDFYYCYALTTVTGQWKSNGYCDLNLAFSPLTNASVMVFINGLANISSAKNIKLKSSTYDTLTAEQIAVATSKGWTVIRSA